MGLSETILAAMIGAGATVGTALFQLLTAFKAARGKTDTKPKRGSTMRSVLAVLALMVASAAGGFLYSQLLREREGEDIRAMRQELRELRDLTASNVLARGQVADASAHHEPPSEPQPAAVPMSAGLESTGGVAESIAYVPACRMTVESAGECHETDAQRIALCGTIPAHARVNAIQLFAQPDAAQQPWDQHGAALEADVGGARFTGKTFEYAQGQNAKAVCVNFLHWSSQHPHIARIVVQYEVGATATGEPVSPPVEQSPPEVLTQTTIAAEGVQASPQPASFATTAR
ncbi:MAG TPA: hypothetical protein VKB34_21315 [Povalibacter sp.]|nr:hypothetical protein [Povalibacter sp.]